MKARFFFLLTTLFLLQSCGSDKNLDQYLVDVSKFNMDETALKDGEKVRIIGASGNLTNDDEMNFYNLIVVESLETGNVVNVLMVNYIFVDENNRDLNFISFETEMGKLMGATGNDGTVKGKNIDDLEIPKFDKVLYDTEYLTEDLYGNPTIIGGLAIVTHASPETKGDVDKMKEEAIEKVTDSIIPSMQ